ncbi:MAG: hypothetical protein U9P80_05900 [Thermodesulfobacteriota bacterium]|nr:hypothetical protein [Thermodesulfobacteriota bacterium]
MDKKGRSGKWIIGLFWVLSVGFAAGIVALFMDKDTTGMILFAAGLISVCPLLNRFYEKNNVLKKPIVRLALAMCCYGVLFLPALNGNSAEGEANQPGVSGHGIKAHPRILGYYNSPWPGEDGGPERLQVPYNLGGLDIKEDDEVLVTRRFTHLANMMLLRDPGEVYLLTTALARNRYLKLPAYSHVELVDPQTLKTIRRSVRLKAGPGWPGGFAIHRNGDIYVVFGRWCHRLDKDCNLLASYRLPYNRSYNSLIILDNGYLAMKEMSETASHLTVLDPETLRPVCDHIDLYEPSIARISGTGNTIYIVGTRSIFRYNWSEKVNRPVLDKDWIFDYVQNSGRSFGWDPVIEKNNAWFLDNGDHGYQIAMLGVARNPAQTHFVRVSLKDAADTTVQAVSGLPEGTITNPPIFCENKNIFVAYDSANSVVKAYKYNPESREISMIWEKEKFGASNHMIYFPDTGELCTNDYKYGKGDASVILDVETGEEKGRTEMNNIFQGVIFSCPGWDRDYYYVTFDRIARVYVRSMQR